VGGRGGGVAARRSGLREARQVRRSGAASTVAWNHGGSRPRAVLLCSLAAWSSAGHGGSLRPAVVRRQAVCGLGEVRRCCGAGCFSRR
jgi:hypothetical protein